MSSAAVVIGTLRVKIKICFIQLKAKGPENIFCAMMNYEETLNSFGAKFQTTFVVCFVGFNKISIGKKLMCIKLKNRMSNSVDTDETAHDEPSHMDLRCLQKPNIIACGSERTGAVVVILFL